MTLRKGYQALLDEAARSVRTLSVEEARELHGRTDVQFVDLRDPRELEREGKIPGAFHAPRGMLEFWVDPESPYYKDVFAAGKTFVFYCQSGWRSALATRTVQDMGLPNVCHVGGGYRAWKDAGADTEAQPPRGA
ncbi:MAG: rhodanese-like domain-containing protein [bacterium]|jgi:rhodanese-related sulfurtransferase